MGDVGWLGVGFGIAWVAIAGYVVGLWRAERALRRRIDALDTAGRDRQALE